MVIVCCLVVVVTIIIVNDINSFVAIIIRSSKAIAAVVVAVVVSSMFDGISRKHMRRPDIVRASQCGLRLVRITTEITHQKGTLA